MQLFVLVLNKTDLLEVILEKMAQAHISGATVLESTGMARVLNGFDDIPLFSGLRNILEPDRRENNTVFAVLKDHQIASVRKIVNDVTGGISQPDTGIMFSVPIGFVEGLPDEKE